MLNGTLIIVNQAPGVELKVLGVGLIAEQNDRFGI